ncbi:hypothetical protein R6Q59_022384 [Mikania micrantha]
MASYAVVVLSTTIVASNGGKGGYENKTTVSFGDVGLTRRPAVIVARPTTMMVFPKVDTIMVTNCRFCAEDTVGCFNRFLLEHSWAIVQKRL